MYFYIKQTQKTYSLIFKNINEFEICSLNESAITKNALSGGEDSRIKSLALRRRFYHHAFQFNYQNNWWSVNLMNLSNVYRVFSANLWDRMSISYHRNNKESVQETTNLFSTYQLTFRSSMPFQRYPYCLGTRFKIAI